MLVCDLRQAGTQITSAPRAHTPCVSSVQYNIEAHLVITMRVLKPRSNCVMTKQTLFCYGQNKALTRYATLPGQPPHDQRCSSHMDTEKASTLPV